MARETETPAAPDAKTKTGFGQQAPLPLAERRRVLQPGKTPQKPGQIFTDWALI